MRGESLKFIEGAAKIEYAPNLGVFFNPRGQLARSFGVLAVRAYSIRVGRKLTVADAFTGVGTRAIRYLLEASKSVDWVFANDSSPVALSFAVRNALNNNVIDRIKFSCWETRRFFWRTNEANTFFDVIDLDVFGTPMPFIQFALVALKYQGAIYITSTDTAPLCGINRRAAFRNYGAVSENLEFCHEIGARIVIASVIKSAAQLAFIGRPLFTLFDGYAFRIFMEFQRGRGQFPHDKIGFIFRCPEDGTVFWTKQKSLGKLKLECDQEMQMAGPLWLGELHDPEFLDVMKNEIAMDWFSQKDSMKIKRRLKLMEQEIGMPPFFYEISKIADREDINVPPKNKIIHALKYEGFKAAPTQFSGTGIKSDAPYGVVLKCLRRLQGS